MAGFKAFSGIHTTGCVFTYSSFLFITLRSDRYTAEISPDEGHMIQGARYEAPDLTRRKGRQRCELRTRRRISEKDAQNVAPSVHPTAARFRDLKICMNASGRCRNDPDGQDWSPKISNVANMYSKIKHCLNQTAFLH